MRTNELTNHTFESTGVTVLIRKVSPYLAFELQRAFPPPKPPVQEVDYGDGEKRYEENPSHPDYERELQEYQLMLESKIRRLMIKRGVVLNLGDEELAELAALRAEWLEDNGFELPEKNDLVAYISYIAIGTQEDADELVGAITKRSIPTEADIALAEGTFQR